MIKDSIIIVDGLTKNWRLPGFRVCWVVGPKNVITALSQSGSFLDGGANHPLQLAAIPLLELDYVHAEKIALQRHFKHKRDHVLKRLERLGLKVAIPPDSTFYVWLNLDHLPAPLNNGLVSVPNARRYISLILATSDILRRASEGEVHCHPGYLL